MRNIRTTITIIWGLSVLSVLTTLVILLVPLGIQSSELANRAQVSATVSSTVALILGIIAIIVTARVSSSDYQAQQDVKASTARLLASFRSIIAKGVVLSLKPNGANSPLDFKQEREVINEFLSSTTAFAYWSWEGYKSHSSANKDEEWRDLFLYLVDLLDSEDSQFRKMISRAVTLEALLTTLTTHDIQQISNYVSDLSKAVGDFKESREQDVLIKVASDVYGRPQDPETIRRQFLYLKKKGIEDPNIDFFLADSDKQAQAALEAGADPNITDTRILAKYRDQLKDFKDTEETS